MVALGPQLDTNSVARAVSGDGSVVVGENRVPHDNGGSGDAFIWDGSRGMRSLQDALTNEYGLDLGDRTLIDARGISADGRVIVGLAISASSGVESFVAFIPEPAGIVPVLGVAASLLLRRARRIRGSPVTWASPLAQEPSCRTRSNEEVHFPSAVPQALVFGLAIVATSAVTAAPLPGASFRSLGSGVAHAVSADGTTVVGERRSSVDGRAFRRTAAAGIVDLEAPSGVEFRAARAVSADGSVIVGDGGGKLVRWTSSGGAASFGSVYSANGVSADGSVVVGGMEGGFAESNGTFNDNPPLAYRWTAQTRVTSLGALGTWEDDGYFRRGSQANGISADGSVIVGWSTSEASPGIAFRWTAAHGMVALGRGAATAASADGSVVVGLQPHPGSGEDGFRPFRWTEGSGMVSLEPHFPGAIDSAAHAVSGDGSVIVGSARQFVEEDSSYAFTAFIWDSSRGTRSLQDVLTGDYGLDLGGLRLTAARGISADARVIVGEAVSPSGATEAFVAVVPEPAGLALAAVACPALLGRRRRSI